MTIKPHILSHLVEQFERKRNLDLSGHIRVKRMEERETLTLNTLEQFRHERLDQRRERAQPGTQKTTVDHQSHESRFDARLVSAIRTQNQKLEKTRQLSEKTSAEFREAQRRLTAINLLQDRQAHRARQARLVADQKHNDELASQRNGSTASTRSSS